MSVQCPYCGVEIKLKAPPPGRFAARCKNCQQKFAIVISKDPNTPPKVIDRRRHHEKNEEVGNDVAAALGIEAQPAPRAKRVADDVSDSVADQIEPVVGESESGSVAGLTVAEAPAPVVQDRMAMTTPPPAAAAVAPAASSAVAVTSMPGVSAAPSAAATAVAAPGAPVAASVPADGDVTAVSPSSHRALRQIEKAGRLGGYEIIKKLGQGGMGAVYLARQISLDRSVAVKVLNPQLAHDASFVARFTREAYAAAQLSHHNIVQIHDIGAEEDLHYFSMEFVQGQTLGGVTHRGGRLDPESAAGYVLQAARGLKFAHERAMIHRDIKPENLLLNDQGLVKVADMGLVKRKGITDGTLSPALSASMDASQTGANLSMGTPSYMAPEQARDAAQVDARADIYSLGCTLYDLLTGRPPFTGKTVAEVLTKHASEPLTPADAVVSDVPRPLAEIVTKMMAKRPEDRYANMTEVIKVLEEYLGVGARDAAGASPGAPLAPREQDTRLLEAAVSSFNGAGWARLRVQIILAYFVLCGLLVLACMSAARSGDTLSDVKWAGGFFGLAVLSFASYIVLTGVTQRAYFFRRIRQYLWTAHIADWAKAGLSVLILLAFLILLGLQWMWLGFLVASIVLIAAFHFVVDKRVQDQRKASLAQVEGMLKTLRIRGLEEESLRQFVCHYSGNKWEEFFETLFGYEAKLDARRKWGMGLRGRDRKKWASWRDPIIAWIDQRTRLRQEEREQKLLARVEERKLRAQGMDIARARAQAEQVADEVVHKAGRIQESTRKAKGKGEKGDEVVVVTAGSLMDDTPVDEKAPPRQRLSYIERKYGSLLGMLVGPAVRFWLGAGVLATFLISMYITNPDFLRNLLTFSQQKASQMHNTLSGEDKFAAAPPAAAPDLTLKAPATLNITDQNSAAQYVNVEQTNTVLHLIGSNAGGLAGAILLFSALFSGVAYGLFTLASAVLIVVGGKLFWLPTFNLYPDNHAGMWVGGAAALVVFLFFRE